MARILLVDDEEIVRVLMREALESSGHEVTEAMNGNEGVAMQRAHPFDLIITDIVMPEKEGLEMIIELKKDFPVLKIIAVSGGGRVNNSNYLGFAKKFGAQKILTKPVTQEALLYAVNGCLAE